MCLHLFVASASAPKQNNLQKHPLVCPGKSGSKDSSRFLTALRGGFLLLPLLSGQSLLIQKEWNQSCSLSPNYFLITKSKLMIHSARKALSFHSEFFQTSPAQSNVTFPLWWWLLVLCWVKQQWTLNKNIPMPVPYLLLPKLHPVQFKAVLVPPTHASP